MFIYRLYMSISTHVGHMKKGFLKILLLKIIAGENDLTGYDLIKRIEKTIGRKPSNGTVYPLLKAMVNDGWIERTESGSKAFYHITDTGIEKLTELKMLKREYMIKVTEMLSIADNAFEEEPSYGLFELVVPLFIQIRSLLERGIDVNKIKELIDETRIKFEEMAYDKNNGS